MSTTTLIKKGVKERCCHKKTDLEKLRQELRQRCKLRMREQRETLLNQRRFGVSSDDDVQNKLKEIFHTELSDLATTKNYDVPEGTADVVKKIIDNEEPEKPISEEEKLIAQDYFKLKEEETTTLLKEQS